MLLRIIVITAVSVITALLFCSDDRFMSLWKGELGSRLRSPHNSAGALRALSSRGKRMLPVSGSSSLISRVGNGLALLTKMNCSRWVVRLSDTKPITGTGRSELAAFANANERCCPSTIQADLIPSSLIGIVSVPACESPASPVGLLPRAATKRRSGDSAKIIALGKSTFP
ncbi:hypothetical protein D3C86_1705910 [compost metagenome]